MDRRVAELNIEHFQKMLAGELAPQIRETIQHLLEEEQVKLKKIMHLLTEAKTTG